MTTRTWNGVSGNFTDAGSWSPNVVPVAGDVAIINSGTVQLQSNPSGVSFQLTQRSGSPVSTTLNLSNIMLDNTVPLIVSDQNDYSNTGPTIGIDQTVGIAATDSFFGGKVNFSFNNGATLVNTGTLDFYGSSPLTNPGGTLQNSGTIALLNPMALAQSAVLDAAVTGIGTIALGAYTQVAFAGPVAAGQTILLNDGSAGRQTIELSAPSSFSGVISGFSQGDTIKVDNTPYTNATYTSSGNTGVLRLYSGLTLEASLTFSGTYSLGSFGLLYANAGNGVSTLQITTTAVNAQSGGLPAGYANGGGGGATYRFFDTTFGTHFFTADANEAATVKATRPDLVEEVNNFGSVTQSDPNAAPIYRFFDTVHGTHFFTASVLEAQAIQQTRSDLTPEPASTFYEHSAQQAGDVPVYRFFDTALGTHFYTGSQTEYAGITNPGSATYRANLTFEGIGFYAPAGSHFV